MGGQQGRPGERGDRAVITSFLYIGNPGAGQDPEAGALAGGGGQVLQDPPGRFDDGRRPGACPADRRDRQANAEGRLLGTLQEAPVCQFGDQPVGGRYWQAGELGNLGEIQIPRWFRKDTRTAGA